MNQPENMTLKDTLEKREREKRAQRESNLSLSEMFSQPGRWALLLAVVMAPWAFGMVHHWSQQWICIALLVSLGFWWFETAMNARRKQIVPYLLLLLAGGLLIGMLQLVPLPAGIADSVVGRQQEIYQTYTGKSDTAVYVSLDREGTWGQIRLLVIAMAGLLLGCRYFRSSRDIVLLLSVCTINGCLLSFFGIIQKLTYNGHVYWVYEVIRGAPFGPFINRNNGAGFLLLCLACCLGLWPIILSKRKRKGPQELVSKEMPVWRQLYYHGLYFTAELTATKIALLMATVLIASGVVSCLSRGGMVALFIGAMATLLFYGMARRPKNGIIVILPLIGLVILLSGWIGFSEQLIERFGQVNLADLSTDGRIQHWKDTWPSVSEMGALGSGLGSYRGMHRLYSSGPELALFEYAENQFFQSVVEAGWPGLTLFLLAWLLAFHYAFLMIYKGQSMTSVGVGTMGLFLLFSQATASMFDFGLYVPANMLVMAVLVGFLAYHAHALSGRLKKTTWLRFQAPSYLVQVILLVVFAGLTVVSLDIYRRARLDSIMAINTLDFSHDRPDLASTDEKIDEIGGLVRKCRSVKALNYLAELWIHRSRLEFLESLKSEEDYRNAILLMNDEERQQYEASLWAITSLQRSHEHAFYLKQDISLFQSARFLNSPFIRDNLPLASGYLVFSRQISPLQPVVHIRLGQITALLGETTSGGEHIERAIMLAPNNTDFRLLAGIFFLQMGDFDAAAPHLRHYLELLPHRLRSLTEILKGQTSRRMAVVTDQQIVEQVLPDNPKLLYEYSLTWLADNEAVGRFALGRANRLLEDANLGRIEDIVLRANVRLKLGLEEEAIEDMQMALKSNPLDDPTRYQLARVLFQRGDLEEALEEANRLLTANLKNRTYNDLVQEIEMAISKKEISSKEVSKDHP